MENLIFKRVFKIFLLAFALSILSGIGVEIYYIGLVNGYQLAKKDLQPQIDSIAGFIKKIKKETFPSPSPTPQVTVTFPKTKPISWGGPELWTAVNKRRTELGVNPLIQRDELCTIASIRLNELLDLGKLDGHEGFSNLKSRRPDLAWIFDKYSTIAEFLAEGGRSPEETVSLWENTLGHKKLLSGGEFVWGCIYAQNTFAVAIAAF